jgi:hypothetical protein
MIRTIYQFLLLFQSCFNWSIFAAQRAVPWPEASRLSQLAEEQNSAEQHRRCRAREILAPGFEPCEMALQEVGRQRFSGTMEIVEVQTCCATPPVSMKFGPGLSKEFHHIASGNWNCVSTSLSKNRIHKLHILIYIFIIIHIYICISCIYIYMYIMYIYIYVYHVYIYVCIRINEEPFQILYHELPNVTRGLSSFRAPHEPSTAAQRPLYRSSRNAAATGSCGRRLSHGGLRKAATARMETHAWKCYWL